MKQIVLTLAALLFVLLIASSLAIATESRTGALAGASNYLLDDSQIYSWPCRSPLFYRALIAELGVDGSRISDRSSVTGIYANQEQTFGVAGLAINRSTGAQARFSDYLDRTYTTGSVSVRANIIERLNQRGLGNGLRLIPAPAGGIEILYARKFGDWTPGVRIERSAAENTENITGSNGEASSSVTGITVSASYQPKDALRADASLEYAGYSFSSSQTLDVTAYEAKLASDGARAVTGQARIFYDLSDEMTLVPRLALDYSNLGYAYTQSDTGRHAAGAISATRFNLGIGWQYAPSPKYAITAGLELGYRSSAATDSLITGDPGEMTTTRTDWDLPSLHLALEAQMTRWLVLRVGGSKYITSTQVKTDYADQTSKTRKFSSDSYQLGLGLGLKFGGLSLDLKVNPELIYSGGNVISGSKTWPVSQASILYRF